MHEFSGNDAPISDSTTHYRDVDLDIGREASILGRALERLAEISGRGVSAHEALRAAHDNVDRDGDWTATASGAAQVLGLRPVPLAPLPNGRPRQRPALLRLGPGQWLVAADVSRRRQRVLLFDERGEIEMTITSAQLRAAGDAKQWLHIQPLLALDPIRTDGQDPGEHPWLRLRSFLGLERRILWVVVVYALVIGALTLATPVAVQALVNTVAFGTVLQPLVVLTLLLFGGLAFSGLLSLLEAYVVEVLQRRVFVRVADDFGRRLPAVQNEALEGAYGPELANRFFDVVTIQKSLAGLLLEGLALVLQTAIGMVLLGFYHPLLLTFDVVLVALLALVLLAGRGAVHAGLSESSAKYKMVAWLEDISRTTHLFRGSAARQHACDHTQGLCRDYLTARKSHFRILVRQIAGGIGLQTVAMVALLGVGGWLVINRQLTLGQLVAAELVIAAMGSGFIKLGKNLEKLYDLNVGVLKLTRIVDMPMERSGGEALPPGGPAPVALRQLGVTRGDRQLLSSVEFDFEAGERIRLAGKTGSGKSTLLDVVGGLRQPSSGCVHLAGVDLRRVNLATARDRVCVVRGTDFVDASIIENIRIASGGLAQEAEIRELLRLVDLEHTVDALPRGLDSRLMPRGGPLSETQARRLSLVRALACRPRLLLIDRALDGLGLERDQQTALLDIIFSNTAPWTALIVTDDDRIAARCARTLTIADGALEISQ